LEKGDLTPIIELEKGDLTPILANPGLGLGRHTVLRMNSVCTRRTLLTALSGLPLLAADFWDKKPLPQWTRDDLLKLLTDSPWAKTESKTIDFAPYVQEGPVTWKELGIPGSGPHPTVEGGSPVGGIGAPNRKNKVDMDINVRWSSALPIKQATVLHKYGADGLDSSEARGELARLENLYVIDVSGAPALVAYRGIEAMQADLHNTVRLFAGGKKRPIKPESTYVASRGAKLAITVRFPKTPPITVQDKQVRFWLKSGPLEVFRTFKLKPMVYNGALEL